MPTVGEILAQILESSDGAEKVAEVNPEDKVEDKTEAEKIAESLNLSKEEIEAASQEIEESEKHAEAEKKAEEAITLGRFMARGLLDELQKLGMGVGGSEPTTTDQGCSTPQDGSVANRVADAIANAHGQKQTPKKEELKAVLQAAKANFMVSADQSPKAEPKPALSTESK